MVGCEARRESGVGGTIPDLGSFLAPGFWCSSGVMHVEVPTNRANASRTDDVCCRPVPAPQDVCLRRLDTGLQPWNQAGDGNVQWLRITEWAIVDDRKLPQ